MKRKKTVAKGKAPKVPLPPRIPLHQPASFSSIPLHDDVQEESEQKQVDKIMLRQFSQRPRMLQYSREEFAKNVIFSLFCGGIAGAVVFFICSFLAPGGIVSWLLGIPAFIIASAIVFGITASR